jgi:hypothetical protein
MSTFVYTEPCTYQIGKRECFDEDNLKPLLVDDDFNKGDRSQLSKYKKQRSSGGKISVTYKFGKGCEELKLGRLYPDDGIGLQSFRSDMRNPLAAKYYWDTDFENANYHIALHYTEERGLANKCIQQYVTNPDETLKMVSTSRKKAKTEFLKTLYLGNVKMYNEWYHEVDGEITAEGTAFIQALSKEVKMLALAIWDENKHLHKVKTGKDQKTFAQKTNPDASLMSVVFQTEERKMLMVWDAFLAHNKRNLAVFIHDGGYVEKLEKETQFPPELLEEGACMVERETGIRCVLTQKDIVYDWTPKKPQEDQYARLKVEFEKHTFLIGAAQLYHIMRDGTTCYMTVRDAAIKFAPLEVDVWIPDKGKSETRKFLDMWIKDPERLAYDRVDFYPNVDKCPPSVYNLFKGFNAEKFRPETTMSPETIEALVQPIITHMDFLTSGNSSYLLKLFANIVQNPGAKSEVAALIRDQGDLLTEGGGTGKNMLIEFLGNKIIGEEYCIVVGDNKEFYAGFNSLFEAKLFKATCVAH